VPLPEIFLDTAAPATFNNERPRHFREPNAMRRGLRILLPAAAVLAGLLMRPVAGSAAALTSDQQRCVNDVNKAASLVAKSQNKADLACLQYAARGVLTRLGVPPQAQTAQACLTNDVRGHVARQTASLQSRDLKRCQSLLPALPAFGHTDAATVDAAARAAGLDIVRGLFGSDLDAAIVSEATDSDGARCQRDVLHYTSDLFSTIWKVVLTAKKNALKGRDRRAGNGPVATAEALRDELIAAVAADGRSQIAKAAAKLRERTTQRCTGMPAPLGQVFPGTCSGAATAAALGACAEGVARGSALTALAAADALAIDCDLTDDGVANLTCESPELREHVLNRLGYGPDAWSRARIETLGVAQYIAEQLAPETIDDSALDAELVQFPSLTMSYQELRANYSNDPVPPQQGLGVIARELKQAKVLRAVMSRRQLVEVLVDFWLNHFNVAAGSSRRTKYDIGPYDRSVLRPHVLGSFEDMLVAVAKSPAMGDYLDNRRNRASAINENYAREIMELHTLSVTGPYTEHDVQELARCFTGWKENYDNPDGFEFNAAKHDQGAKTVIGVSIPANGGMQDGLTMLDVLAHHPSTAQFISRKLVMRFVSETPPQRLVDEAAGVFLGSGGDLRAVMQTILMSPEFLSAPQYRHAKVKRPLVFYASLARALGVSPAALNTNNLRNRIADMGEDLYDAGPPTGYPDVSSFWLSPGTAVKRCNDAEASSRGAYGFAFAYPIVDGTPAEIVDALAGAFFVAPPASATRTTAIAFLEALPEPNPPARVAQAAALLLSSPEFLTH
jgi:uncharacterized protein (DUF1800 family)